MESNWMTEGACIHHPPEIFFPNDGAGVSIAKRICATCTSAEPCLEYALAHRIPHGVWGGTSERQRRRILRERQIHTVLVHEPLAPSPSHTKSQGGP